MWQRVNWTPYVASKFWMVWNRQGSSPTLPHNSHEAAMKEAERLAKKHPGQEFAVLVAEKIVSVPEQPVSVTTLA